MKIKSFLAASTFMAAAAFPMLAQAALPPAYAGVPALVQIDAQLSAQGYTITDIAQKADGSYAVMSKSATGELRLIEVDPATGSVADTVADGIPTGTPGVSADGKLEHEANESPAMEALESDGGNETGDSDTGSDSGISDHGSDHGSNDQGPDTGDSDSNDGADSDGGVESD